MSGRLRFFTPDEHLVMLLAEANQQLQQGKQQLEQECQRAEKLAERLRAIGIEAE
ncbi:MULTISPECIES: hypothetical protein [Nostoc]|uniref:Uncharacterized protein n=2 Tax=Nostoc TaxID=1177 RepID=A0ABR8II05_9NOSO|nr:MULTISPECIES: hypothetical protein [Nostoc]MBD2565470.1 hypothetical protein [Nostoc linckia FACHB-391]MBD2650373.1 hypothetical protein [Nostoc foliaceum FACHB-393]